MKRSVFLLAAAALLIFAPGRAGAGEGHGWRGGHDGRYGHKGSAHRHVHGRRHRHHHEDQVHSLAAPEPAYGHGGTVLVELRDPYLPPGVLYNVPGPPPAYAHSTVIRAKY